MSSRPVWSARTCGRARSLLARGSSPVWHTGREVHAVVLLVRTCVENKVAQASANWHSGGAARRQSTPQAAPSVGQPRPISRLGLCWHPDHVGLGFDLVCAQSFPM